MYIQKFVRKAARIGQLDLYMWCALRTHKWRRVLLMYVLHTCLAYVLHTCLACVLVCQQSSGLFNRQVSPPKNAEIALLPAAQKYHLGILKISEKFLLTCQQKRHHLSICEYGRRFEGRLMYLYQ